MLPQPSRAQNGSPADPPNPAPKFGATATRAALASAYHGGLLMLPFGVQLRGEGVTPAVGLRFDRHTVQRRTVVPAEAAVANDGDHRIWAQFFSTVESERRRSRNIPSAQAPWGRANGMSLGSRFVRLRPAGVWADAVASTGLNQPDLRIRGP
jgi:hypothetical protein